MAHFYLSVGALKKPTGFREEPATYHEIPEATKTPRIWSPRVVDRERIKDFELNVEDIEEKPNKDL